jgi:two-component system, OmpR family, manganese sensing sensor histidine kinase
MFQTTRRRLAIWYTTVTAIVLLVFAIGMYIYVRSTLIERIDDTLNHVVEVVSRSIAIDKIDAPGATSQFKINVGASFQDDSDRVDDDRIDLELFSLSGKLLWSTLKEPLDLPVWLNLDGETVRVRNDASPERLLRQITAPIDRNGILVGFLRVSHPWFEVTKPTDLLIIDLTIGTSLVIASVAAIGWFLSGIAIEPVKASYQQLKQFTADASHELRNPIATIQTNVQVALSEEPLQPQQRQQLQTIERLTRRLGRLVDDLLFLARQDSNDVTPQFSSVPLDALLMETIEEQQLAAAARGINLTLEIVDPLPTENDNELDVFSINGDWDRLVRLFTNLLTNAIQYTLPYGKHPSEINIELKHLTRQSISYLQVQVKDNGMGIPADALPHLFDRFYRVDPARTANSDDISSGSGLGLAIVKSIITNHHGELSIDSQVGVGTTVIVTFKGSV